MSAVEPSLIERIIRDDVRAMGAYHVPDSHGLVKLDAMENPYRLPPALRQQLAERLGEVALNRYPVPSSEALRAALKRVMQVPAGMDVLLGNGSEELIRMLALAAARPVANVMGPLPGIVM